MLFCIFAVFNNFSFHALYIICVYVQHRFFFYFSFFFFIACLRQCQILRPQFRPHCVICFWVYHECIRSRMRSYGNGDVFPWKKARPSVQYECLGSFLMGVTHPVSSSVFNSGYHCHLIQRNCNLLFFFFYRLRNPVGHFLHNFRRSHCMSSVLDKKKITAGDLPSSFGSQTSRGFIEFL